MLVPLIITYYEGTSSPSSIIQLKKDFKLAALKLDKKRKTNRNSPFLFASIVKHLVSMK